MKELASHWVGCPICGGSEFVVLARNDRYRMRLRTVGCCTCGFLFTNPQPTPDALRGFYTTTYRELYQSISTPSLEYIDKFHKHERAEAVCQHMLAKLEIGDRLRTIVDIGCAEGSLLLAVGKHLSDAKRFGVEVNEAFRSFASSHADATVLSSIDELPKARFDLVILNHVLEHVADPCDYLRQVRELLAPLGRLYLAVPDACAYRSVGDLHIAHLFHYTKTSLGRLLRHAGFEVATMEITEPPNHPVSIAAVARIGDASATAPFELDVAGWRNIRSANRYRLLFYARRSPPVRWLASRAKDVLRK